MLILRNFPDGCDAGDQQVLLMTLLDSEGSLSFLEDPFY